MTTETRGRNILATELLKDGYHERAERVAAGNEFMSDEPAVRACVEAVGERAWQPIETAPKDQRILSTNRHGVVDIIAWWPCAILHEDLAAPPGSRFTFEGAWDDGERGDDGEDNYTPYHPTVWQPLPAIEAALALPSPVRQGEDGEEAPWIVWSNEHSAFWRANRCGYTGSIEQAGRYTRAEAEAICRSACPRSNSTIYEGTPPEICMPAPEALSPVRESVLEEAARIAERYDWRDEPETRGYAFWNPDTGYEWSRNHPVKSGEAPDVSKITRMTYRKFREQSVPFAIAAAIRALKSDPDFTGHIDCPEDEGGRG